MSSPGKTTKYDQTWGSRQDEESWQVTTTNPITPNDGLTSVPIADSNSSAFNQHRSQDPYATMPGAMIYGAAGQDTTFAPGPHKGHAYAGTDAASMAVQGLEPSGDKSSLLNNRPRGPRGRLIGSELPLAAK